MKSMSLFRIQAKTIIPVSLLLLGCAAGFATFGSAALAEDNRLGPTSGGSRIYVVSPSGPNSAAMMMVVDASTARVTATFPLGLSNTLVLDETADRRTGVIYVGSHYGDGPIVEVSTTLNGVVGQLPLTEWVPTAVAAGQLYSAVSPTEDFWFAGAGPGAYNLATGSTTILRSPTNLPVSFTPFSGGASPPNGGSFWAPFEISNAFYGVVGEGIAVYRTATNTLADRFPVSLEPSAGFENGVGYCPIAFSPDSSLAYIAEPLEIVVYNAMTLQKVATYTYVTTFGSLAVSPDGATLYGTDGTAVYVLDAVTGMQRNMFTLPAGVQSYTMGISKDGTALFLLQNANAVEVLNASTGEVHVAPVPYYPVNLVVVP
jgi:hypothetical protein